MLRSMKELFGYAVAATDGTIGKVEDFLFDPQTQDIRYLVADTGGWLNRHHVLVARVAFGRPRWPARDFPLSISRDQVRGSPELAPDAAVSRQHEADLHAHYEWVPYWLAHGHGTPTTHVEAGTLYRAREVIGYQIRATDDTFGHLADFILDDDHWRVHSLIADTEQWWPPQMTMVDMASFRGIDAGVEQVELALTERMIRESPTYDPSSVASREHEVVLYDYRGRPHT